MATADPLQLGFSVETQSGKSRRNRAKARRGRVGERSRRALTPWPPATDGGSAAPAAPSGTAARVHRGQHNGVRSTAWSTVAPSVHGRRSWPRPRVTIDGSAGATRRTEASRDCVAKSVEAQLSARAMTRHWRPAPEPAHSEALSRRGRRSAAPARRRDRASGGDGRRNEQKEPDEGARHVRRWQRHMCQVVRPCGGGTHRVAVEVGLQPPGTRERSWPLVPFGSFFIVLRGGLAAREGRLLIGGIAVRGHHAAPLQSLQHSSRARCNHV